MFYVIHALYESLSLCDKHLNGLYFVLNPLCNLGFFIHISSIFLANSVVLQVHGREMMIGTKIRRFGAELMKAETYGQKASTTVPASHSQYSSSSMLWH